MKPNNLRDFTARRIAQLEEAEKKADKGIWGAFFFDFGFYLIQVFLVLWMWNWAGVSVGLPPIDFWQVVGLKALINWLSPLRNTVSSKRLEKLAEIREELCSLRESKV